MGGECSNSQNSPSREFELVKEQMHESLGRVRVIRKLSNNVHSFMNSAMLIGVRDVDFESDASRDGYIRYMDEIKEFENIPTLVKILSYEIKNGNNGNRLYLNTDPPQFQKKLFTNISKQLNSNKDCHSINCSQKFISTPKITIFFEYFQPTLNQAILNKKTNLLNSQKLTQKIFNFENNGIKLCDYETIDKLGHHQRKIVNLYYQEIEILRMIDHVVGALYFLHHFGYGHGAVHPSNILIDHEGKYLLLDPKLFALQTNYSKTAQYIEQSLNKRKQSQPVRKQKIFPYLAPEFYKNLKNREGEEKISSQKSDIFGVGILALEMCLLEIDLNEEIVYEGNVHLIRSEMTKLLLKVRNRYSNELVDLLKDMLQFNPKTRINYSKLIDKIQPLLTTNLSSIQKIFADHDSNNIASERSNILNAQSPSSESRNLISKLMEFDRKYSQVMRSSFIMSQKYQPFNREAILADEKCILEQLQKKTKKERKNKKLQRMEHENEKKQLRGTDLYDLYLNEYESIRKTRKL